ncbi:Scavenger receptor cysteine-rich protein type 12 isoform X1 [Oopsacas minuta]|uniref:Scavenger receptor cysteine-rich protein type 12 isoform X1 n=1 Tax=Oopsacas minuta TaxID=111878 RepID=A0AAV7KD44_9METZ|nr:Scavenger receptor cysteine-rich protein type 12 isoform X1 [Oopsacas minuta]
MRIIVLVCLLALAAANRYYEGDLRLVGGVGPFEGRVEYYHAGEWGSVCDDRWDIADATVVCRQLGYPYAALVVSNGNYGQSPGNIWLDEVACNGTENRLSECPGSPVGEHNCLHWEDAGVVCSNDFQLRIVNSQQIVNDGHNVSEGRLEVYHGGVWGTICDDGWTFQDADVACKQMGFTGAFEHTTRAQFGQGEGIIWMDQVSCLGDEPDLSQCSFAGWGNEDCSHYEDAGVVCIYPNITLPAALHIQLAGGTASTGRVEILYNNTWGTVCDDLFTLKDAQIACRQLGYVGAVSFSPYSAYGEGTGPIWLDNVRCRGLEDALSQCIHSPIGQHDCFHNEDVGVECSNDTSAISPDYDIRLSGSNNTWEGRVEVFYNNTWGTICDDAWDIQDANVACRQLGFRAAYRATERANFGEGTGPIWLDDVQCRGSEEKLSQCVNIGLGLHNCYHSEDAGVVCERNEVGLPVRLVGGAGSHEGRVEVLYNDTWGTVCDDIWTYLDATVVCRQMGFSKALSAFKYAAFGIGTADQNIWLDQVNCNGTELDLSACPHNPIGQHNCDHTEDASVICSQEDIPAIRLRGSANDWEGRVEIAFGGTWGTVCGEEWTKAEADVVCYQLGYPGASRIATQAEFGAGSGSVVLENVICQGYESYLTECDHDPLGTILNPSCTHNLDAGVVCNGNEIELPVRLVGGNTSRSGRVEVYYSSIWGSVCDDYWSQADARVVCNMLGYSPIGARAVGTARFGSTTGPIWLDDVQCDGYEAELSDCVRSDFSEHNCDHSEDAGVICQPDAPVDYVDMVRLGGGGVPFEGRVEVKLDGDTIWGSVCGYGFTYADASVICKQLGYPAVTQFSTSSIFKTNSDPTIVSLGCRGNEDQISECHIQLSESASSCDSNQAGVTCSLYAPTRYPVRLTAGTNQEGIVEVFYQGRWGTICDDQWNVPDADVICKQIGFPASLRAVSSSPQYLDSSIPVWLSGVDCEGTEDKITDCRNDGWGSTSCNYHLDAGVTCEAPRYPIRLRGGESDNQGTVEIYVNGTWGLVCDDSWDMADGLVACRELGYPSVLATFHENHFNHDTTTPIFMDDLACIGDEMLLSACEFSGYFNHNCFTFEAAGVNCSTEERPKETIVARLVGGHNQYQGRLEVYHEGVWGTVCDDFWQQRNAEVVCRQLGFEGPAEVLISAFPAGNDTIWLDDVICTGTESQLGECFHLPWASHNCRHFEDVDIQCYFGVPKPVNESYEVRIVAGPTPNMGVVEIFYHGKWGSICGSTWSKFEADVVCKQLGYLRALEAIDSDVFGVIEAKDLIWLNSVSCTGTEATLNQCTHSLWGVTSCNSYWDYIDYYYYYYEYSNNLAAVVCTDEPYNLDPVRLMGGEDHNEGRVEINYQGEWGTICGYSWTMNDANVLCQSLGYYSAESADRNSVYGAGDFPFVLDTVGCYGNETFIQNCPHSPWGYITSECSSGSVAGVKCNGTTSAIRLSAGTDSSGIVEVEHAGVWGTICSGGFGYFDAKVICADLGYPGVKAWGISPHSNKTDPVWLNFLGCTGTETSLDQCYKSQWGVSHCYSNSVAVVNCSTTPAVEGDVQIALVDGSSDTNGRVEINLHNIWGTVCNSYYYGQENLAKVICDELGFPSSNPIAMSRPDNDVTGVNLPIHFSYIYCTGEESSITECYNDTESSSYDTCTHQDDLYVECDTSKHCPPLDVVPPLLSSYDGEEVPLGQVVSFSCSVGILHGDNTRLVCIKEGKWFPNAILPHCVTGCPLSALNASNLTLFGGLPLEDRDIPIGKTVLLTCMSQATFNGASYYNVKCGTDGTWLDVPSAKCVLKGITPGSGLSTGVIVGSVIGVLFLLIAFTAVFVVVIVLIILVRNRATKGRMNLYRTLPGKDVSESMEELTNTRLEVMPDAQDDDPILPIN